MNNVYVVTIRTPDLTEPEPITVEDIEDILRQEFGDSVYDEVKYIQVRKLEDDAAIKIVGGEIDWSSGS